MPDEPEPRVTADTPTETGGDTRSTGIGLQIAGIAWLLIPFFFAGGYITMAVYWLLPLLGLAGVVFSVIDLVKGKKWALLGLVLSIAPFLLILGAIGMMISGPRYK